MNNHSTLPLWGPYSKKYNGISHIPPHASRPGVRFDLTTVPAVANMDIKLPNISYPTGWHPWSAASDYSQITYRQDLEWKDRLYSEVSYTCLDDKHILIRTELVNHTDVTQNLMINYFASIEYPQTCYVDPVLPDRCVFLQALDYDDYHYHTQRPWDQQNPDGLKKGEIRDCRYTSSSGLGDRVGKWHLPQVRFGSFGAEKGDEVTYRFFLKTDYQDAVLSVRYCSTETVYEDLDAMEKNVSVRPGGQDAVFLINDRLKITFPVTAVPSIVRFPLGAMSKGEHILKLTSQGTGGLEFDFLAITEASDIVSVKTTSPVFQPEITENEDCVTLRYPDVDEVYCLKTYHSHTRFRHIETGSLEDALPSRLSNPDPTFDDVLDPFSKSFSRKHSDDGFFHNTLVHTIFVGAGERHIEYAVVGNAPIANLTFEELESVYQSHKPHVDDDSPYAFSTRLLDAALISNVVYPIQKDQHLIIHHTPGKRWDSLYTWDSGFIGLGMTDINRDYAERILDQYLAEPGHPDYAFVHHGSPVPVQFYLFYELLQRNDDKQNFILRFYPKLRYYYEFLIGRGSGSTTGCFQSGLTSTYDYFYSSSGMDDYPAQVHMIQDHLQRQAAPAISSASVIRCAKILTRCASWMHWEEDVDVFLADIDSLSRALNTFAWDREAGYYGYVLHDRITLQPTGIYRTADGENLNKGLDGIYPLIAGVSDDAQTSKILSHLQSPLEMLSPYGISAVDQSASYFQINGYWNGHIWFPHQWLIWKTMLDLGETDFAWEIAKRALEIWKREVERTYNTFEMVNVQTGLGGWYHQFGGLSAPVSLFEHAYFRAGTINTGFDTWIDHIQWNEDHSQLSLRVDAKASRSSAALLIVMNHQYQYHLSLDGQPACLIERHQGTFEILIKDGKHNLLVEKNGAVAKGRNPLRDFSE